MSEEHVRSEGQAGKNVATDCEHRNFFHAIQREMSRGVDAVIVADDDSGVRLCVTSDIARIDPGISIYEARNGREVLERIREIRKQRGKDPAFIVLDLEMPIMDGWDVISHLRDEYTECGKAQGIPIIVLSGHSGDKRVSTFKKKTVHGRRADYCPMITIAKEACVAKRRYHATGRAALLTWLAALAGCREDVSKRSVEPESPHEL